VVGPADSLHELNLELDNLGTSIQEVHRRLDDLGDVNSRLDDLASQLDAMYITVQDAHKRIDDLAQSH
jgi:DNA repair ATPase RecN